MNAVDYFMRAAGKYKKGKNKISGDFATLFLGKKVEEEWLEKKYFFIF